LETTLLALSQQFEPVRDIDKQAVEKDLQSRETTFSRHSSDRQIRPIDAPQSKR
jgi:hypothetical protein